MDKRKRGKNESQISVLSEAGERGGVIRRDSAVNHLPRVRPRGGPYGWRGNPRGGRVAAKANRPGRALARARRVIV